MFIGSGSPQHTREEKLYLLHYGLLFGHRNADWIALEKAEALKAHVFLKLLVI